MAASYPLALPTIIRPRSVQMKYSSVVGVSESPFTLERQNFTWPGCRWSASVSYPPMTPAQARQLVAWAIRLRGQGGSFLMGDPAARVPLGVATGTPVVDGGGQSGTDLATRGWTPSTAKIYRAGDYLQIGVGPDAKLYMNMTDVDADSDGKAVLELSPPLRTPHPDGATIITRDAMGVFVMASNDVDWSVDVGLEYGFAFAAVEDV